MSGRGTIYPQSAELVSSTPTVAGQVYRGIPAVGLSLMGGDQSVQGLQDWSNLLRDSPPTLLERYDLMAFQIPWGILLFNTAVPNPYPTVSAGLNFLVNGEVRYTTQQQIQLVASQVSANRGVGSGIFQGDIINPISLGARDRLSIEAFYSSNVSMGSVNPGMVLGATMQTIATGGRPADVPIRALSTLSYEVVDLPASRRL